MFEMLSDIYVDSGKHKRALSLDVSNINTTVIKEEKGEYKEMHL